MGGYHSRFSGLQSGFASNHIAEKTDYDQQQYCTGRACFSAINIAKSHRKNLSTISGVKSRRRLTALNRLESFDRLIAALRQISAAGVPCSPCLRMKAFCASVNFDDFRQICSFPSFGKPAKIFQIQTAQFSWALGSPKIQSRAYYYGFMKKLQQF